MELTFSLSPTSHFTPHMLKPHSRALSHPSYSLVQCNYLSFINSGNLQLFRKNPISILKSTTITRRCMKTDDQPLNEFDFDLDDGEEFEDPGSPWAGAVIYKRNPSITHVEYCTTLERLGLGRVSTDLSKSTASAMGLRVTKAVKDYPLGTPVQISVDVTRNKKKLKLDGIIKTVISLYCNRCGKPTGQSVFSNFSLLLSEDPIEEPDIINLGVIYGDSSNDTDEDGESSIDLDDRLYFPPEQKEIDISKNIRDTVHVEITINGVCDPMCKGACLKCGENLNTSTCKCTKETVKDRKGYGPLGNLREKLQTK